MMCQRTSSEESERVEGDSKSSCRKLSRGNRFTPSSLTADRWYTRMQYQFQQYISRATEFFKYLEIDLSEPNSIQVYQIKTFDIIKLALFLCIIFGKIFEYIFSRKKNLTLSSFVISKLNIFVNKICN